MGLGHYLLPFTFYRIIEMSCKKGFVIMSVTVFKAGRSYTRKIGITASTLLWVEEGVRLYDKESGCESLFSRCYSLDLI